MLGPPDLLIAFRDLHVSAIIGIRDYCCHACRGDVFRKEFSRTP